MADEESISIAIIQTDLKNLSSNFSEFKEDSKKERIEISKKLDALTLEWQKFGGLYNGFTKLQEQVNVLTTWKERSETVLDSIRKVESNWQGLVWDLVKRAIIGAFTAVIAIMTYIKFK